MSITVEGLFPLMLASNILCLRDEFGIQQTFYHAFGGLSLLGGLFPPTLGYIPGTDVQVQLMSHISCGEMAKRPNFIRRQSINMDFTLEEIPNLILTNLIEFSPSCTGSNLTSEVCLILSSRAYMSNSSLFIDVNAIIFCGLFS